jgi:hypothetical protein
MALSSLFVRGVALAGIFGATLAWVAIPSQAQSMRQQMASKIATEAGDMLVSKINGESCSQFGSMMAQMKNSKSSSGSTSSHLKSNPQARTQFVNIVAGPLVNKMIDCNMLPGGM